MATKKRGRLFSLLGSNPVQESTKGQESFYYEQVATIVGAGGWKIDFTEKKSFFDKQLRTILETPETYIPSLKHSMHFFDMEFHDRVKTDFENLQKDGTSYEQIVRMITYTNKLFWARVIGKPIRNDAGKITGVKGVILNIDNEKKKEIALEKSIEIIEANNSRLFKFANYVSHNLKSHVNNLELTSQLVDEDRLQEDQKELFNNYREIAKSLSRTVSQLNEIVSIQSKASGQRTTIDLEKMFESCIAELGQLITKEEAYIYSDFSEVPEVEYIPEFLKNIFCTLIKNGILDKSPDRKPEIKAYCLEEGNKTSLIIEDNGTGFDTEKNPDRIFHMSSKTDSDHNSNSAGLFIVKNQVEALGGKIDVVSKPGYGTKFIITL